MNTRKFLPIRILSAIIAICVLCAGCVASTKATAMRLIKVLGTVGVEDAKGKNVSIIENLGLYNGYQVGTQKESYAWVNLDDVKLTKLDSSTEIEIHRKGKHLEILVKNGRLFFHVVKPLEDDESLEIRTSSMVTGIRGTSGWVECSSEKEIVCILDGTVECVLDNSAGKVSVSRGEMATVKSDGTIAVTEFYQSDIPKFVREEAESMSDILESIPSDVSSGIPGDIPSDTPSDTPITAHPISEYSELDAEAIAAMKAEVMELIASFTDRDWFSYSDSERTYDLAWENVDFSPIRLTGEAIFANSPYENYYTKNTHLYILCETDFMANWYNGEDQYLSHAGAVGAYDLRFLHMNEDGSIGWDSYIDFLGFFETIPQLEEHISTIYTLEIVTLP